MPALSMLKVEKVATPLTALTVAVPASVPLPGLVPMASVTLLVALVMVLPKASCTVTATEGLNAAVDVALVGWTVKASVAAGPAVTANAELVTPVRPVAAALSV